MKPKILFKDDCVMKTGETELSNQPCDTRLVNQKPIMFVNTESFLNEENLKKMETFSDSQEEVQRTCLHILGSVHQNHIDAPFVIRVRS